jgi:hypothetical protein
MRADQKSTFFVGKQIPEREEPRKNYAKHTSYSFLISTDRSSGRRVSLEVLPFGNMKP